jgi:glutamine amidotransferase
MIAIVNYGLGNVCAFANAYKKLNIPFKIAAEAGDLKSVKGMILPGVGAFDYAMERLEASQLLEPVQELVVSRDVPVLGICVGMQMLASSSEEGHRPGLGWIDGVVQKFDTSDLRQGTPLPHMGWNNVDPSPGHSLFEGLDDQSRFYFLHSYVFQCRNADDVISTTDYGGRFASAVGRETIFGVQFHPEKSHHSGVQLLRNFAHMSLGT